MQTQKAQKQENNSLRQDISLIPHSRLFDTPGEVTRLGMLAQRLIRPTPL